MTKKEIENKFWEITHTLKEQGKFVEAIEQYKKIVDQANEYEFLDVSQQIGSTYSLLEQYDDANVWFDKTIEHGHKINDFRTIGNTMRDQGMQLMKQSRHNEALQKLESSIRYLAQSTDYLGLVVSLDKTGVAYAELNDYFEALDHINAALTLVKYSNDIDHEYMEQLFNYDLAKVKLASGNKKEALQLAQEAYEICLKLNHTQTSNKIKEFIEKNS